MPRRGRRIERTRRGTFRLRIPPEERAVLETLPGQLRAVLAGDDPNLRRLFPPAYPDDPEAESEYRDLTRRELLDGREQALEVMEATVRSDRLTEDQLVAWLSAINDLRLVLGTRLDVTEDPNDHLVPPEDPRAPAFALYHYLGWLQEEAVTALAAGLGPGGTD
jgi:hypothetical protein